MGLLQVFHLLASAAVLVSVVWPVGRGVWARYLASASPSPPTLLEKTKVEGKEEEEEGSETETDGERSMGSVGSLSEEDGDMDADASEEVQEQAHCEAEACILDDSTPSTHGCAPRSGSTRPLPPLPPPPPPRARPHAHAHILDQDGRRPHSSCAPSPCSARASPRGCGTASTRRRGGLGR
ncbi:hypothetical protein B0H16DRAFT_721252 [Mycena metata]|uniref:Uncharacterized protein n=1 Tax=Mycena metata TaxID=1033252 RepID=A0AAD7GRR8_9AGAR|nr:hypothetical protein B0H16DRAFT_721252 [Mycena metata]